MNQTNEHRRSSRDHRLQEVDYTLNDKAHDAHLLGYAAAESGNPILEPVTHLKPSAYEYWWRKGYEAYYKEHPTQVVEPLEQV